MRDWVAANHYTDSAPPGFRAVLEYSLGKDLIGAMIVGRPSTRALDPQEWLEVTRIYFLDDTPKNVESRALGMMRKFVRIWMPEVRMLISYADPEQGHEGVIYRADGWAQFGMTKASKRGWDNRAGRKGGPATAKLRFLRTP